VILRKKMERLGNTPQDRGSNQRVPWVWKPMGKLVCFSVGSGGHLGLQSGFQNQCRKSSRNLSAEK
jgi:hypothetical protein